MSIRHDLFPRNDAERQALRDACASGGDDHRIPRAAQRRLTAKGRAAAEVIQTAAELLERFSQRQPLNPMGA